MAKRIDCGVRERASNEVECKVEVCEGEECEEQTEELVHEFNVEKDLACNGVVCVPDLLEMNQRINGSEESSIEPTATL